MAGPGLSATASRVSAAHVGTAAGSKAASGAYVLVLWSKAQKGTQMLSVAGWTENGAYSGGHCFVLGHCSCNWAYLEEVGAAGADRRTMTSRRAMPTWRRMARA